MWPQNCAQAAQQTGQRETATAKMRTSGQRQKVKTESGTANCAQAVQQDVESGCRSGGRLRSSGRTRPECRGSGRPGGCRTHAPRMTADGVQEPRREKNAPGANASPGVVGAGSLFRGRCGWLVVGLAGGGWLAVRCPGGRRVGSQTGKQNFDMQAGGRANRASQPGAHAPTAVGCSGGVSMRCAGGR